MDRIILHSDCNNFFASVESVSRPELLNVPVAVSGAVELRHGIILAKNEIAKKFGVKTAEPVWKALKKCPELVLLPPHHKLYEEYSRRINEIYIEYTDLVEKFSIDESWLDVTGSTKLFGDGKAIADAIRERIKKELGITVSIGVSFNKIFAKLGSDYKKPDATTVIDRDNFKKILYPLPVSSMIFVGKSIAETLSLCNIKTIGDLANTSPAFLEQRLGKAGTVLSKYAKGEDDDPVMPYYYETPPKSIGKGMTFVRNLVGEEDIKKGLFALCDNIAIQMREKNIKCMTVRVQVKDANLSTIQRQTTLKNPTYLAKDIFDAALELILANWSLKKPIRMLTVTGTNFISGDVGRQMSIFEEDKTDKKESIERTMDRIRDTFGKNSIKRANVINNDIGIEYDE